MRKMLCMLLAVGFLWCCGILEDLDCLRTNVIRLHVVGASDSEADQTMKLRVKDTVNAYLEERLKYCTSMEHAREILVGELDNIQQLAQSQLYAYGFSDPVQVTLGQEAFGRRDYDTFSLPSGVYESLRISIGNADGKNWWCVVFPTLCIPAAGEELQDVTAGAGFSEALYHTITLEEDYEIRFFILDLLGQFQNFWFES